MNITKVEQSDEGIVISYNQTIGSDGLSESVLRSKDLPRPEFSEAMRALKPVFRDVCEFTHDQASKFIVRIIWFQHDQAGKKKIRIMASRVMAFGPELRIITPLRLINTDGNDAILKLNDLLVRAVEEVEQEAMKYIKQERQQQELFK